MQPPRRPLGHPSAPGRSPFIDPAAVEAWDAWFRWREQGVLRDATLDDTWRRITDALAPGGTAAAQGARQRYSEALGGWRVLPDERILASAGTASPRWSAADELAAVVNVPSFVQAAFTPRAALDVAALRAAAGVAVCMLDDAARLVGGASAALRIGVVGLADALAMMGLRYDTQEGRACAIEAARALAEGSLRASVELAKERGPRPDRGEWQPGAAVAHGVSPELLARVAKHGTRHARLTAIEPHPRLALLANNVSDALDPLSASDARCRVDAPGGARTLASAGFARSLRRQRGLADDESVATPVQAQLAAQTEMRAALQPWVDRPIEYALRVGTPPAAPLVAW